MALLGLLFGGPGHGYDLHRTVINDLGHVWHLSQSQAYTILKRLETHGDVLVEEVSQKKLPSRQLHSITLQGKHKFLEWMEATSGGSTRAIRLEFITRLYFTKMYFPEKLSQVFERQRQETRAQIQRLETTCSNLPGGQIYNLMSIDLRLKQLQGVVEWMEKFEKDFME